MKWWHWLILELLIIFGVMAWIYFFPREFEDDFAKGMIGFVLIYAIEKYKDINRRNRMSENYTIEQNAGENQIEGGVVSISGSVEKNIDFCELRNLVYEITDLNESAIAVLEKVNSMESNKVITVLKCNEEKMNLILEKLEEEGV